mgnify:CR=1 FL=1
MGSMRTRSKTPVPLIMEAVLNYASIMAERFHVNVHHITKNYQMENVKVPKISYFLAKRTKFPD